jgi:hypothetical protein
MLDEYYHYRGCSQDGLPTRKRLQEVGLSDVAEDLKRKGGISDHECPAIEELLSQKKDKKKKQICYRPVKKAVMEIPGRAVIPYQGKNIVFVIEGDRVRQREVDVVESQGGFVEVTKGLQDGEQIVVAGHAGLQPNDRIKIE